MKQKTTLIKTVLVLSLSVCLLTMGMLHIFASDPPTEALGSEELTPTVIPSRQEAEGEDADAPTTDVVIDDGSVPLTVEQITEKFAPYTHLTEENGKSIVTLYSAEQIVELNALHAGSEPLLLTAQEMLYLLDDTKRLFETYDVIRVYGLDGTLYTYPGLSFYTSAAFSEAFSAKIGNVSHDVSYDLKNDAYEAMLFRINALHSYSEYISYREDMECMFAYTEWDGFTGEDPRVIAEGITRHATYSSRFTVARNYVDGDDGSDGGRYPEIPQYRLNLIRSTPGAMLVFYGEEIFYIDDMADFDGTNMITLYPDGIFPGNVVTGKYENGEGQSIVIEVWDEASRSCIARLRLDDEADATEVQKITELWNGIKDIRTRGGKLGAVGEGNYRVAVYFCGFPHKITEGGSEQQSFWYKPGADPDLWSLIWWDDVMGFFSDNYVGATEITTYINGLLEQRLIK